MSLKNGKMPLTDPKAIDSPLSGPVFQLISIVAVSILLSGCVVGPDYSLNAPARITDSFKGNSVNNRSAGTPTPVVPVEYWWQSFADPTLNALVSKAMNQSLSLQAAFERIVEARANYRLQTGRLLPDGNTLSDYQFLQRSQNARPFVGQNGDPFNLFSNGFAVTWELDLFGRIERSIQAAEASVELQEHDLEYIRQVLIADIASSYLRVRLLQEQIMTTQKSIGLQTQTVDLIENRALAGASTDLDRAQTKSFLRRSEALLASQEQQLEVEFNQLSLLLGESPGESIVQFVGNQPLPRIPAIPDTGIPADLLRRRPDVRRDERAVAAASALIGVAEADLYPRLTLLGDISLSARSPSQLFQTDSLAFSIGPAVTWNVLHAGRICSNIEVFESQFRQALIAYQQTVLDAVREVEDGIAKHHGSFQQWDAFTGAIEEDQIAVELSLERYEIGKINFQRVLDAQQQLLSDQQERTAAQAAAIEQLIRTFKALGGGWTSGPSVSQSNNTHCSACQNTVLGSQVMAGSAATGRPVANNASRQATIVEHQTDPTQSFSNPYQLYPPMTANAGRGAMIR